MFGSFKRDHGTAPRLAALEAVRAKIMIADDDLTITYMNPAVVELMREVEADLRKELPRFSLATLVGMQNGLVMGAIGVGGSDEQRAAWLPKFASAEYLGCFGLTEPLSGSDSAQGLRTTAERQGDEWVINGAKRWIGNGTVATHAIIWAKSVTLREIRSSLCTTTTSTCPASMAAIRRWSPERSNTAPEISASL